MEEKECYRQIMQQLSALLSDEHDVIANMANTSAVLYQALPEINWAGFYIYKDKELCLGPFQGKPACMHIAYGKGVCGTCVKEARMQCVKDMYEFPGHIACDSASRSEIVVPLYQDGKIIAVLDIDSPKIGRFDHEDEAGLCKVKELLEASWSQ